MAPRLLIPSLAAAAALAALVHPALALLAPLGALGAVVLDRRLQAPGGAAWLIVPAIVVCVFNFESLIARIGVPFLNPFNVAWLLSAGGLVVLRTGQHRPWLPRTALDVPLLVNAAVTTMSVIAAGRVLSPAVLADKIMVYQQWLQWLLFYWVVAALVSSRAQARLVVRAVVMMVAVAAVFGIKDYLATRAVSGGAIERSQGLFGQANYAASFFAYYTPLIAALMVRTRAWPWRLIYLGALALGLVALTVTFGRGGLMAGAAGMGVIVLCTRSRTLLVASVIAGVMVMSTPEVRARFDETVSSESSAGPELDDSSGARLIAWQKAIDLIGQRPLFGHGFYTFRYIDHPLDHRAAARFGHGRMDVHNGHLNTAVSAGLLGSLALGFQFAVMAWWCLQCRRRSHDPFVKALAEGLLATVLAIVLVNLTGTRLYDRQIVGYLWILLGALHGAVTASETGDSQIVSR